MLWPLSLGIITDLKQTNSWTGSIFSTVWLPVDRQLLHCFPHQCHKWIFMQDWTKICYKKISKHTFSNVSNPAHFLRVGFSIEYAAVGSHQMIFFSNSISSDTWGMHDGVASWGLTRCQIHYHGGEQTKHLHGRWERGLLADSRKIPSWSLVMDLLKLVCTLRVTLGGIRWFLSSSREKITTF